MRGDDGSGRITTREGTEWTRRSLQRRRVRAPGRERRRAAARALNPPAAPSRGAAAAVPGLEVLQVLHLLRRAQFWFMQTPQVQSPGSEPLPPVRAGEEEWSSR